jgi:protein gp37
MGCDGCELWHEKTCIHCGRPIEVIWSDDPWPEKHYQHKGGVIQCAKGGTVAAPVRTCYAGIWVNRHAGLKGYPMSFDKPELFLHRLLEVERWPDLRGKERPDKPWMNGLPRGIFLDDLGDTFTASLDLFWLATPAAILDGRTPLEVLAKTKAIIMVLTKRADRMRQFFDRYPCPDNFIPMTSVTGPETVNRVRDLTKINAKWHGISAEPLLKEVTAALEPYFAKTPIWAITGGESGPTRRPDDLEHYRTLRNMTIQYGGKFFMKQRDKVLPIPPDLLIRQIPPFTLTKEPEVAHANS